MDLEKEINRITKDRTFKMASFISLLIGAQGLVMSILSLFTSNTKILIVTLSYSIVMLITFFSLRKTKNIKIFYVPAIIMVFALELSYLRTGGTEGFGIIWMLIIPIFSVYLLDMKNFIILNTLVLIILVLGLVTPLSRYTYDFKHSFEIRFPLVYALEFFFGLFLKYRIQQTEEVLEKQTQILEREIERAAAIQKNYYNQPNREFDKWDLGYVIKPMASVTGDLYDIFGRDSKLDGVGVFDISGHGISSGLVTMLVKNIIHQEFYDSYEYDISETMDKINARVIAEKGKIDNYLTGILIRIQDDWLDLVNAGHPYPLLYRRKSNEFEILKKLPESQGVIGIDGVPTLYATQFIDMEPGDEIVLYTDGVTDTKNENGDFFKMDKLISVLNQNIGLTAQEQVAAATKAILTFRGEAEPVDDITLMILKRKE